MLGKNYAMTLIIALLPCMAHAQTCQELVGNNFSVEQLRSALEQYPVVAANETNISLVEEFTMGICRDLVNKGNGGVNVFSIADKIASDCSRYPNQPGKSVCQ
jgi:hypothetical protein